MLPLAKYSLQVLHLFVGGHLSVPVCTTSIHVMTLGKKYKNAAMKIDAKKLYTLDEAVALLVDSSTTKFDATCEIHVNLNADPKYADQIVRSTVAMPHGTGKSVRVIAFVGEDKAKAALAAGAVKAGANELIEEVNQGFSDFDVAVATPDMMRDLAKVAKVLGPKGLMPNPKSGTVTPDIEKAISELQAGKIEFKTDKFGIVHSLFGKVSFGKEKLTENLLSLLKALNAAKPTGIKGVYIKTMTLTTTMGPGIHVDLTDAAKASSSK